MINQKAITQLLEQPHLCHGQGLLDLNSLLLVDSPSSLVSGKIRRSESWVGPAGSSREQASFIPPSPSEVPSLFAEFIGKWSGSPSPLQSRDQAEICSGIALFHHEMLRIHPFEDGNGKVARAISDQQARHLCCVNKRLCLRDSPKYLESLSRADSGDIDLLVFIVKSAISNCFDT
ncbi:Fic family protein [Synechococcus sp. FACHB-909]|uniref:Fic family protein n=1 Tax=Synechococcus sp. FACHB-909 TaxID=2692863 RepID=UPI00336A0246